MCQSIESTDNKCQNCMKNEGQEQGPCPYKVEIYGDEETLCNCCEDCQHECYMNV